MKETPSTRMSGGYMDASGIIGESSTLAEVFRMLHKVAPTDSTVLVTGESGTGNRGGPDPRQHCEKRQAFRSDQLRRDPP